MSPIGDTKLVFFTPKMVKNRRFWPIFEVFSGFYGSDAFDDFSKKIKIIFLLKIFCKNVKNHDFIDFYPFFSNILRYTVGVFLVKNMM